MALLNDLKKLLFGAKAVTKSVADKAVEAGKEAGRDLASESVELFEKAKDKVEDIGKIVLDKADQAMDKAADFAEGVGSKVMQATEVAKAKAQDIADDFTGKEEKAELEKVTENETDSTIMDEIMAETKPEEPAAPAATEGFVELPPLQGSATPLLEAPDVEPGMLDTLKSKAVAAGDKIADTTGEALDTAGDFVEGVGKKVRDTGSNLAEKFGETAGKVGGAILTQSDKAMDKAAEFTEGVGKKVMESGGKLADKFSETAEDVGEVLFEKGGEAVEKAKGFISDLGSKILKTKDDLVSKAEEEATKSGEGADSLIDKMKNLNQKLEDKISGNNQKFADKPLDTGGSEFSKHESFWDKAEKFAKGDYHMKGEQSKPGEMKIQQNPDYKASDKGKVKGFDDKDGDGDELIDDAIVEN
jgi:ElaB/YqjD/DUF883 family membrane-anchored ribosome-binding protein